VTRAEIERDPVTYIQHVDAVLAATAQQLAEFREETGREFVAVRADVAQLRTEMGQLRTEMGQLRAEMGGEFAAVRAEMGGEFAAVRAEMAELRAEMRGQLGDINTVLVQVLARLPGPPPQ
jgi:chromosome segregation ATPase